MTRRRKRAKKKPSHPVDPVRRHPRWGATEAQGRRYQRERELLNNLESMRITHGHVMAQLNESQSVARALAVENARYQQAELADPAPVPMILTCPSCSARHVDVAFANKRHHTHSCQHCGMCWRPAVVATVGVQFLPGFHDDDLASGKVAS